VVHLLGLLRKRLHHVRATTESLPDLLRPVQIPVHLVVPLALLGKVVAVAAQEILARRVQHRRPPTASCTGACEPRPLPAEVARRPVEFYRLLHVFRVSA
jgi:hypothetical protein